MNRFFTLLLAASCLTAVGQVPDYVPTDGLVAWYPLDSSVEDESVNGYNLCANSISYTSGRHEDEGGAFLGVYGGDLLTACSSNGSWTTEISYALWFKPLDLESDPYPSGWFALVTMDGWNNDSFGTLISDFGEECEAGKHRVRPSWPNNQSFAECGEIELGQWHHLCVTGNEDSSSVFLDGELLLSSQHLPGTDFAEVPFEWTIGASSRHHTYQFKGAIDEVGIWNAELSPDEVLHLFITSAPIEGCTDLAACNFDATATLDDGTCHFNCQFCLTGTVWSEELGGCIGDGSGDINLDGCVQLNDLLDLLGAYGDCGAIESPWQCGDPLEYQGYDYETVQIGEQCWFAENLRATQFRDGEDLVVAHDPQAWMSLEGQGVVALYESASEVQGHFYSLPAVLHESGICPSGWKVPSDSHWAGLEIEIGMPEEELGNFGYRGVAELIGLQLKSTSGWPEGGNGTDAFGFEGRPAGAINDNDGQHNEQEIISRWWSSTPENATLISRYLRSNEVGFRRLADGTALDGFSIRCIQNAE